jgi:hypothetical protein
MILAGFEGKRGALSEQLRRKPQVCLILALNANRCAMPTAAETLEYIASLVKELAEMSDELGRPTLSYLLRMAILEAEGEAFGGPRVGGKGWVAHMMPKTLSPTPYAIEPNGIP